MQINTMRDVFLASLYEKMASDSTIFFVTADFGSPVLDKIRKEYPSKFINVGIAEQNLINVATGLALEGFNVYAYAIAPFITMRCYEQIRVNVSILSSIRNMNINIIGVGAGVSYTMSGPTHHCLEDLSIMNTLPNMEVFSPSDHGVAEAYVTRSLSVKAPKYMRFDAKPMSILSEEPYDFNDGFRVLQKNGSIAVVSTGYMTHKAMQIAKDYNITVIDLYLINNYSREKLHASLEDIKTIITLEEGFINSGGLDAEINFNFKDKKVVNLGFEKKYCFEIGDREFVHAQYHIAENDIRQIIQKELKNA